MDRVIPKDVNGSKVSEVFVGQATREMSRGGHGRTLEAMRDQKTALVNRKMQITGRLSSINSRLKVRLPRIDKERADAERDSLIEELSSIEKEMGSLKNEMKPLEKDIGGTPLSESNAEILKRVERIERKVDAVFEMLRSIVAQKGFK